MRAVEKALAAIALVGGLRIAYAQVIGPRGEAKAHAIDARYAGARQQLAALPVREPVAYLETNGLEQREGERRLCEASYALAPRILLPDDGKAPLVLLDLERAEQLDGLEQRASLSLVWKSDDGLVALARRGGR